MRHTKRKKGSPECHGLLEKYENVLKAIARASNQLIVHENVEEAIPRALQIFGQAVEAKRVIIFQVDSHSASKEQAISMRYEWKERGVSSAIGDEAGAESWNAGIRENFKQLEVGHMVHVDLENFSEHTGKRPKENRILSHSLAPIRIEKKVWGCVGVVDYQEAEGIGVLEGAFQAMASNLGAAIKRLEEYEKRKESETKFLDTAANVPGVIYQWVECRDGTCRIDYISPKLKEFFGIEPEDAMKDPYTMVDLIHPDDKKRWKQSILLSKTMLSPWNFEGRLLMPSGDVKWWQGMARPSRAKNGDIIFNGIMSDVTERKHTIEQLKQANEELERTNKKLQEICTVDTLTGIPNRRKYEEYMENQWKQAYRDGSSLSVIFIDIDNFKAYNDHYGHLKGDDCLEKVAHILNGCMRRSTDFLSRLGGEEFVAVLPGTTVEGARLVAEHMRKRVKKEHISHPSSSTSKWLTISAGVAGSVPKEEEYTMSGLLELADKALYEAKRNGKNQVVKK